MTLAAFSRWFFMRIQVIPCASLNFQKHSKRAEYWLMFKGTAETACADMVMTFKENESNLFLRKKSSIIKSFSQILEIIEV